MNKSIACRGEVRVGLPPDRARRYFTPEGERGWAPGWAPSYPGGQTHPAPGAVFLTEHGGRPTTWVVVAAAERELGYARVVPGRQAGTIGVTLEPEGDRTKATIEYRLTALVADEDEVLAAFEGEYAAMLATWEREIAAAIGRGA